MKLRDDGILHTYTVHRLTAAAFLGPRPDGMEVNHKNGFKNDSRVENLEYVTSSGNKRHAYRMGLRKAKLTERDLVEIKAALLAGESTRSLAQRYNVSRQAIAYHLAA